VLVPFPFTDLSTVKRRPALVVSPNRLHLDHDDVILVALTSNVPSPLGEFEVALDSRDMAMGQLPRPSVLKSNKIFTCHRALVLKRFGRLHDRSLARILARLRQLFA
jgi:mRNA interferase MazF